jgi:hypothetical protein
MAKISAHDTVRAGLSLGHLDNGPRLLFNKKLQKKKSGIRFSLLNKRSQVWNENCAKSSTCQTYIKNKKIFLKYFKRFIYSSV